MHELFLQSTHRTFDPDEADFFYVPVRGEEEGEHAGVRGGGKAPCVCVCVCVRACVRERERERERVCVCVCEGGGGRTTPLTLRRQTCSRCL